MSRFQRYTPFSSRSVAPGHRSSTSASLFETGLEFMSHTSSSLLPQPSDPSMSSHYNTTTENQRRAAAKSFRTLRSSPSFSVVPRGTLVGPVDLGSQVSRTNISPSAYEQPKTPKKIKNTKSKNTIPTSPDAYSPSWFDIAFVGSPFPPPSPSLFSSPSGSHLSLLSYASSSASSSQDLSEDSFWIKDPFKSKFHACDAACNDLDMTDSMTLYSAESIVSLVEDDSSLIPILEPCIAFDFSPYVPPSTNSSFTNPSGAEVDDDSDLSWMAPFAEVEDRSGWVPSAVALGVAVIAAAVAWAFWAPYMVWPSRGTTTTHLIHTQSSFRTTCVLPPSSRRRRTTSSIISPLVFIQGYTILFILSRHLESPLMMTGMDWKFEAGDLRLSQPLRMAGLGRRAELGVFRNSKRNGLGSVPTSSTSLQ
ncbi:hypothetical protein DL98DRAFT_576151 [Cadophora sp. DSE1049]|nr:hypothetical protein DL98DRAFT_576151 [Cadophora sp. DSE1049]